MATGTERDESIAAIAREVADDAVRLAKAEIELAKAQAIAAVKKVAIATGLFAGAAVFALFMAIFALGAVPTALAGHVFSGWTWWLLMAALFLLLAALLAAARVPFTEARHRQRQAAGRLGQGGRGVVQAIDQAERERELTKQSLAGNIDRLEARVRAELDWKARLRRDGVRYALVGGVVVTRWWAPSCSGASSPTTRR